MDKITVACVQQRLRLPQTVEEYQDDLRRFARAAQNKQARLLVFPELAGLLVGVPLLADFRSTLLLQADKGRRRRATAWQRVTGAAAARMAQALQADLRVRLGGLLSVQGEVLWESYCAVFGGLAREFGMTVVAPSAYMPDPDDGVIRNLSAVFGPDGVLLGTQAKVMLHGEDRDLAQPGVTLNIIDTEVGRMGIMLGNDMLYPEIGRLLAYQDAEMLIGQGAASSPVLYNKLRSGMLARMQDNQLFSAISFLVGHNDLTRSTRAPFVGKSAILAPQDLTPRFSGVLVEMGSERSEGVLTAEWDFIALRELWESSDTPVRQQLPLGQASNVLADLYARLRALPAEPTNAALLEVDSVAPDDPARATWMRLDDLPVFASITRRWPLDEDTEGPLNEVDSVDAPAAHFPSAPIRTEDETDEMDAIPQRPPRDG